MRPTIYVQRWLSRCEGDSPDACQEIDLLYLLSTRNSARDLPSGRIRYLLGVGDIITLVEMRAEIATEYESPAAFVRIYDLIRLAAL